MEAQATPGNPREEREDALRAGKGVRGKHIPGSGNRGLRGNRTSVAFIRSLLVRGGLAGMRRLEHQVGLGVFLDKTLEFWLGTQ